MVLSRIISHVSDSNGKWFGFRLDQTLGSGSSGGVGIQVKR